MCFGNGLTHILFTSFPTTSRDNQPVGNIRIYLHDRYLTVAILDDDATEPEIRWIRTECAELEEFAREHQGAKAAIEATSNY